MSLKYLHWILYIRNDKSWKSPEKPQEIFFVQYMEISDGKNKNLELREDIQYLLVDQILLLEARYLLAC